MARELPPRVPPELAELDALVCLLGNRTKNELSAKSRRRLIELCGAYPDANTAAAWKLALRQLRAEVAAEPDPEAGAPG